MNLRNYAAGQIIPSDNSGQKLYNAITGEVIATASSKGLDFKAMLAYGRTVGGPGLRKLTFQERGRMLKNLALFLQARKDNYYALSAATGATKVDSWIDIEGGIGNLFAYASLRRQFPDDTFCLEGDVARLSKGGSFIGHHVCVPKPGIAIHINAFNFPVWGMLEKIAVNLFAGVPAIVKPATLTSFLTELVFADIIESKILPEGSLQLICGSANGILDHVESHDVVTFTGSASTGMQLKSHPRLMSENVPFNLEADSLNAMVLGEDCTPGKPEFDIFIKEVTKEITIKAGQKCTAVRRIIVPEKLVEDVQIALGKRLATVVVGDPKVEGVRMGSLAGKGQVADVLEKIKQLEKTQEIVIGNYNDFSITGADKEKGAFLPPIVFLNKNPFKNTDCHNVEAFGPVSTIIPYKNLDEAVTLAQMGKGSLVSTFVTNDANAARTYVMNAGPYHGRVQILNERCAKESTGHGSPMPMLTHGGPGRAGGGEEMGGKRGVFHYLQRISIQGHPDMITKITKTYQMGGDYIETGVHPFRKHFEELQIGETLKTKTHTVTEEDIVNFAELSGDKFYAHLQPESLTGTIFQRTVAHGYFVLSRAAGLFVDPPKGPVLLNYGIDECRFTKPIYPGMSIGVRFTCKEKLENDKPLAAADGSEVKVGIVKWVVDIYDASSEEVRQKYGVDVSMGDTVGIATILTMVKKKNQA
ncbi:MAG TPA: phenylacetic acid degradation bifunctional protein PaaZ [Flavobacteriales bacterium]|nr:phenylacetic acid degradation bifunctional protein PaaZ [Flavobacteriales bacterium]